MLTLVVGVRAGSEGSGPDSGKSNANWQAGLPVPIAAPGGQARFTVPTAQPGSRTLVIVSALSTGPGPFPIRLEAREIDPAGISAPRRESEGPRRTPDLTTTPLPPVPEPGTARPPEERTFHLLVRDGDVASPSNYLAVKGNLRAVGQRIQVYVDEQDIGAVSAETLRDLVSTFDEQIFPVAAQTFGQARDVDGDGRFTVLMSGWLTRLAGGRHAVDGFVRGTDLDMHLPAPFSNHCDMMYLSTALTPGPHLRTVVAHEYTHAVTYCAKTMPHGQVTVTPGAEEEGWLDEAIAHMVEDAHGFSRSNLDYRVSAFLSQPEKYRLVVDDYYSADLFRSHGNRGGTYLFLRWCLDKFGPKLVPALVRSERHGLANLEAVTGARFADLYRAWSLAVFTAGLDPSRPREPGFRSLELRGTFDAWDLAGPRTLDVTPGEPETAWSSAGTASRYVIVNGSPTGAVEVAVTAPPEAALQVTAVPLPDDLARVELSVVPVRGSEGGPQMRVELRERNGMAVRLSAVAWEPLVPGPDPHASGFRHAGLDSEGIAREFGGRSLSAGGRLTSKPIATPGAFRGRLVVKAVGEDARGRRVAGWADVVCEPDAEDGE